MSDTPIIANKIIEMLLSIPEADREDAISEIQHNSVFCWHCGVGSREHPNVDCQCWNEE